MKGEDVAMVLQQNKDVNSNLVPLDDNNVVKTIGMGFIIVEAIVKKKINHICIKDAHHVLQLHANLLWVNKFV